MSMWNIQGDRVNDTASLPAAIIFENATTIVAIPTQRNAVDTNRTPLALSGYHGHVDADFVAAINPFWLQFPPPPASAHIALGCIHTCIMTAGLLGNALVIFMFMRFRSLRTPANTLVMNLAISDFFMLAKAPFVIYNSFEYGPALGELGCRLYGFFGGLTGVASICTLTAISIDRYFVVVYPLDPLRNITKLRSRLMVLIVWVYSIGFAIVPALDIGLSRYVPEGFLTSCSFDYLDRGTGARIFMFVFFVCAWAVPFAIITYCYYHILHAVAAAKQLQSNRDVRKRTEVKLAGVVLAIIALWFTAWTPYSIVALLGISGNEALITPLVSMVPAVFCKSAACIDPYVYAITHPRFQMEFRRMCGWGGRRAGRAGRGQEFGGSTQSRSRFTSIGRSSTMRSSDRSADGVAGASIELGEHGGRRVHQAAAAAKRLAAARAATSRIRRDAAEAEVRVVSTISEEVMQSTSM